MRNTSTEITQVKFMVNDLIILTGEADLTFQIKLSEQIDRFRRILNSGTFILFLSFYFFLFLFFIILILNYFNFKNKRYLYSWCM